MWGCNEITDNLSDHSLMGFWFIVMTNDSGIGFIL